jgi:hypothetical protein
VSPKANAGTDNGPLRATGRIAFAVDAAAPAPAMRKREEGFIGLSLGTTNLGWSTWSISLVVSDVLS